MGIGIPLLAAMCLSGTAAAAGTFKTLHSFAGTDGSGPTSALVRASDGYFYGATYSGGASGKGTIYRASSLGTIKTLYSFGGGFDGENPWALIQASDGNLYGTTLEGGQNGNGTAFQITPQGVMTTIHQFTSRRRLRASTALVQGTDGNLYGTTTAGGSPGNGWGTVFKMSLGGAVTVLHVFTGPDGTEPYALTPGSDGDIYGVTWDGGLGGEIFKITPARRAHHSPPALAVHLVRQSPGECRGLRSGVAPGVRHRRQPVWNGGVRRPLRSRHRLQGDADGQLHAAPRAERFGRHLAAEHHAGERRQTSTESRTEPPRAPRLRTPARCSRSRRAAPSPRSTISAGPTA